MENIINSSETISNLAKAMLKVQHALAPATKDGENPYAKSKYATLASVMAVCRQPLCENGIWLAQYPVPSCDGHIGLLTRLVHTESGEFQETILNMPLTKNDAQGVGSALTYARRYAICTILGIVTEDDDGNGASGRTGNDNRPPQNNNTNNRPQQGTRPPQQQQRPQQTQPASGQEAPVSDDSTDPCASLPKLDGVIFNVRKANDGRTCIVATGNTNKKAAMLKQAGFVWNADRKLWWMYAA